MNYNFIKKMRNHEFSLRGDFNQTVEDVLSSCEASARLMHKMHPVYRKMGLDKLVKSSERILGPLDDENRAEVETAYAVGTISLGLGVGTGEPLHLLTTGILYGLGLLHHSAMRNDRRAIK